MQTAVTEAEEKRYAELQVLALDCARSGETELLATMIQHGLPANLADAKGNSLLMLASYNGHLDTTRMLLENGADVDRRSDRGQTPLGGVAFKGYEEIVALLLQHGADIDADNGGGMTPLMFAAMFGRVKVVAQLQAHGASHFRQPHGPPFPVDDPPVSPQTTSTRQIRSRTGTFMKNQLPSLSTPGAWQLINKAGDDVRSL